MVHNILFHGKSHRSVFWGEDPLQSSSHIIPLWALSPDLLESQATMQSLANSERDQDNQ